MSDRILDYQASIEHLVAQLQSLTYYGKYIPGAIKRFTSVQWGSIEGNIDDQKDLMAKLQELKKEIEEAAIGKLSSVFIYKGSVPTYADLPPVSESLVAGHCYNVADTGANYVWSGTVWDKLSETIDMSIYVDRTELAEALKVYYVKTEVDELINDLALNLGLQIDMKADKSAVTEVKNYAIELNNQVVDAVNLEIEARKAADTALTNSMNELQTSVTESLATQDGNIQALVLQMQDLQSRITQLKSLDYEVVSFYEGSETELQNEEKAFSLSGEINPKAVVAGESITLKEATLSSAYIEFDAIDDITIKDTTASGNVLKTITNAIMKLHADGYISITDTQIVPEKAYNGIEIGLSEGLAKSVIIDSVNFDGKLTNNAISIFGMDDGGVVTISNCYFKEVSNLLRISNRTNTSWTINLINCTCDKWETGEYAGMVLFQDYTSKSASEADTANQFAKLTINIQNCKKPDGTKITMPDDLSTICSTQDDNQILYMWDSYRGFTQYGAKFPKINIS